MKHTLMILLLCASASVFAQSPKVYQVSKAKGDPLLLEVFAKVVEMERKQTPSKDFEVSHKVGEGRWVVYGRKDHTYAANRLQSIGGDSGGGVYMGSTTDYSKPFLLVSKPPLNVATGQIISVQCTDTGKTEDINGETLRVMEIESEPDLTKEEFIARLKAGRTWSLQNFKPSPCFKCGGDGKLGAMDQYAKCQDCGGKGGTQIVWIVKW